MAAPNIVQSASSTFHHMLCVSAVLSGSSVGAAASVEQSFTINGLQGADALEPADQIMIITKATYQTGLALGAARVTAANTVAVTFINPTAAPIVPTASDVYTLVVFRPNQMLTNVIGTAI